MAANRQSGGEDGWYRGKFRNFIAWAEPDPKTAFFAFLGYLRLFCAQPTGNSFTPNQWYRWKVETLKVSHLLVWRVCDQAFGRCRPVKVPKSGHVTITKIENLHIDTRRKITDSKNAILVDLRRKIITKLSRKKTVASPCACERLAVLN